MGLLDLLPSSPLGLKGSTPDQREGAKNTSTLHFESSINDNPNILQEPSKYDLDGKRPEAYMDNPPK